MTTANRVDAEGRATIKEIICDILEIDADEMTDTSRFKEDHEADSMGAIEILSQLERAFGIDIDQAELARMVNLEGVVTVVDEAVAAKAASH
ncbi:acyl carrier protein [Streptomyces thermolilacinus]|uniref:Polyketide-8 synthase acyl carrier protein n=1 Tax=Streptomyces thermolilacinus SPC6 TaxID=1306406 RepID=A0A1D3DNU2_9ACTN|nr:acyl carrier protein [Streptomyces thermolilacinus]OEJ93987.1 polyketide-8 synthase acyl carrier protein [Streptomyces thermolilacinus SPC6]